MVFNQLSVFVFSANCAYRFAVVGRTQPVECGRQYNNSVQMRDKLRLDLTIKHKVSLFCYIKRQNLQIRKLNLKNWHI